MSASKKLNGWEIDDIYQELTQENSPEKVNKNNGLFVEQQDAEFVKKQFDELHCEFQKLYSEFYDLVFTESGCKPSEVDGKELAEKLRKKAENFVKVFDAFMKYQD